MEKTWRIAQVSNIHQNEPMGGVKAMLYRRKGSSIVQ